MVDITRFNKLEVRGEIYEIYMSASAERERQAASPIGLANTLALPHNPARLTVTPFLMVFLQVTSSSPSLCGQVKVPTVIGDKSLWELNDCCFIPV